MRDYTGYDTNPGPLPDLTKFLLRKMAWDILPHDEDAAGVMKILNLEPASADVVAIEVAESHKRVAATAPIGELVNTYASMATAVLGASVMAKAGTTDPDTTQVFMQHTFDMIRIAVFAIIGLLVEAGQLRIEPIRTAVNG